MAATEVFDETHPGYALIQRYAIIQGLDTDVAASLLLTTLSLDRRWARPPAWASRDEVRDLMVFAKTNENRARRRN